MDPERLRYWDNLVNTPEGKEVSWYRTLAQAITEWREPTRSAEHFTLPLLPGMRMALRVDKTRAFDLLPDQDLIVNPMPTSHSTHILNLPQALVAALGDEKCQSYTSYGLHSLRSWQDNPIGSSLYTRADIITSAYSVLSDLLYAVGDSRAFQDLLDQDEDTPRRMLQWRLLPRDNERGVRFSTGIGFPTGPRDDVSSHDLLSMLSFNAAELMSPEFLEAVTWLHENKVGARVRIRGGKVSSIDMFYSDSLLPIDPATLPMHRSMAFHVFYAAAEGAMLAKLGELPAVPMCSENHYILTSCEPGGNEARCYYSAAIDNADSPLTSYTRLALALAFAKLQARHAARAEKDPVDSELPFAED